MDAHESLFKQASQETALSSDPCVCGHSSSVGYDRAHVFGTVQDHAACSTVASILHQITFEKQRQRLTNT